MPKPELSNKKKWNNSDEFYLAIWNENDKNFKNMMRGVRGRLLHIVASEEYRNNITQGTMRKTAIRTRVALALHYLYDMTLKENA